MGSSKEHSCSCKSSCKSSSSHKCNDCLCDFLKEFKGDTVTITTKSGDVITGELRRVKRCCVKILVPGSMSPSVGSPIAPGTLTFIRCKDIETFSVDLFAAI